MQKYLSRKPDFSPEASVGANAASEARKEEPGLLPPATLFRTRARIFWILGLQVARREVA